MKQNRLWNALGQIEDRFISEAAPEELHIERKQQKMNTKKIIPFFRRPAAAAAAVAICVCITGTTALAATGRLEGVFQDIFGRNGAVVGTSYVQASNEVTLRAVEAGDTLLLELAMVYPDQVPYRELETLGIGAYQILDHQGQVAAEGGSGDLKAVTEGKAQVTLPLEGLPEGAYRLVVGELTGGKKADQSLALKGHWEIPFTK